jgi:tetratricopeptide (TPR) repeat protein
MGGLFLLFVLGAAAIIWALARVAKAGSPDDAFSPISRILVSIALGAMILFAALWPSILSPFIILAAAIPLSLMWTPHIVDWALRPLWSAFDGGRDPVEPRPFYHRAIALRKRGQYADAVTEIESQLERFPNDFEGEMLLAEAKSDDLKDLPAALGVLEEMLITDGRTDRERILVLNRIADIHIRAEDRDSAREVLERIPREWPGTEWAHFAEQRLAHMPGAEMLAAKRVTPTVVLRQYEQNIGLKLAPSTPDVPFETPIELAARLVARLKQFPDDWESREKLATVYANELNRLDLATMEMDQLIESANQPPKAVVRWLNQLADLQLKSGAGVGAARATLERIRQRFPKTIHSENADSRLAHLTLEVRGQRETPSIRLGNYEQNIGLKSFDRPGPPQPPPASEPEA